MEEAKEPLEEVSICNAFYHHTSTYFSPSRAASCTSTTACQEKSKEDEKEDEHDNEEEEDDWIEEGDDEKEKPGVGERMLFAEFRFVVSQFQVPSPHHFFCGGTGDLKLA